MFQAIGDLPSQISSNERMNTNEITQIAIGAAIEVHRQLGPGLLESAYRRCLIYELKQRGLYVESEKPIPVVYKKVHMRCGFRADVIVNRRVVMELKAKSAIHPVDQAQVLSHLRLMRLKVGLLINFHESRLVDGLQRIVNDFKDEL